MGRIDKPLVWLRGEVKTPPFSQAARLEAGYVLRFVAAGRIAWPAALTADAGHWTTVP